MLGSLKNLSLNELFERLHASIKSFAGSIGKVNEMNVEMTSSEIAQLRDHIKQRLMKSDDVHQNEKMLKLIGLFSTDKAVLELVKQDADEWLEFLDAIGHSLERIGAGAAKDEMKEIEEIKKNIEHLKLTIRKEESDL